MLKEKIPLSRQNIECTHNKESYGNIAKRLFQSNLLSDFQCYYDNYQYEIDIISNYERQHLGKLHYISKSDLDRLGIPAEKREALSLTTNDKKLRYKGGKFLSSVVRALLVK